ncbi:MAG: patatin-like phospholipase family protein [Deltaproteobacteria bacterium]|nr:patatin-like phospholipase family protein [Deltaproteobacteria bacterium]
MNARRVLLLTEATRNAGMRKLFFSILISVWAAILVVGCAHYPVNQPIKEVHPNTGYRTAQVKDPENSDHMLLFLTFSGGGTRAASLSYGVLEELRKTEVILDGKKRCLLNEVDGISGVSGGSFTAAYYGLFGDRIFEDFESKFLKKNIQGALVLGVFNPVNWLKLFSGTFGRSDQSAEYYDKHVFEGKTFGDMAARKGPVIVINATDMSYGTRIGFTQDMFDLICSDLSRYPVARAAAASSAVPMALTPITLRNYAGTCGYKIPEGLEEMLKRRTVSERQFYLVNNFSVYLDSEKKRYIHLVDGGVADNLGLRAVLDRVTLRGSIWESVKGTPAEKVQKVVFIVVNAETEPDRKWDRVERIPPFGAMASSYSGIAIERYNEETLALLKENVKSWADETKTQRCKGGAVSTAPGSCGDIEFYVVEVKFDALKDEAERMHFKRLRTSFKLSAEEVDKLRDVAHRILDESEEFQRLLGDLR